MKDRYNLGPPPELAYSASVLDRAAHRRSDGERLEAGAIAYAIAGEHVVLRKGPDQADPTFDLAVARELAKPREEVFLGLHEGRPSFAVSLDAAVIEPLKARGDLLVIDLRSIAVQGLVAPSHLPPLAEGKACLAGMRVIDFARTAAHRPTSAKAAGGGIALLARRSIFRAPIRW